MDDRKLLAWATAKERALLTHDLTTMVPALLVQRQQESGFTPIVVTGSASALRDQAFFHSSSGIEAWRRISFTREPSILSLAWGFGIRTFRAPFRMN